MYYKYIAHVLSLLLYTATDKLNIQLQFQNYAMHANYTCVSVSGLFIWLAVLSSNIWFVYIYMVILSSKFGCFVEFRVSCLLVQILISHPYLCVIGFLLL